MAQLQHSCDTIASDVVLSKGQARQWHAPV